MGVSRRLFPDKKVLYEMAVADWVAKIAGQKPRILKNS